MSSLQRVLAAVVCAGALAVGTPGVGTAWAQLPEGVSQGDLQTALTGPISVPAGQTVTVDLGIPVQASYAADGWSVVSAGSAVTVTVPDQPGSTISVPVSAAGRSTTITLTAVGGDSIPGYQAPAPADPAAPAGPGESSAPLGQPGEASQPEDVAAVSTPPRERARDVDTTDTQFIDLAAVIEGNRISASLGPRQAANLYNQFQQVDQESVTARYLDVNQQIIEGVSREVDVASLSLTLTYPEGQTPDNPFIIQLVRDDEALLVVRLVAHDHPMAQPTDPDAVPEEFFAPAEAGADVADAGAPVVGITALLIGLVAVVAVVALLVRRARRRSSF